MILGAADPQFRDPGNQLQDQPGDASSFSLLVTLIAQLQEVREGGDQDIDDRETDRHRREREVVAQHLEDVEQR